MCAGAILLFQIPTVVILDSVNIEDYPNNEEYLRDKGVEVVLHPHEASIELNRRFQTDPATRGIWLGDVGV